MIGIHPEYIADGIRVSVTHDYQENEENDRKMTKKFQNPGEGEGLAVASEQIERSPRRKLESTSSSSSLDWCTLMEMEDDDRRLSIVRKDLGRYKRISMSQAMRRGLTNEAALEEIESDEVVLVRRQKQVEYGKNSKSYEKYKGILPRRIRRKGVHPSTPDKFQVCSRRSWECQVRIWKRNLHEWNSTGLTHGNRRVPKRMLSADICSDTSSENNDHPMDGSSLNNSISSVCLTESYSGSGASSPVTPLTPMSPLTPDNSYAAIAARKHTTRSRDLTSTADPKTPNGTPAEVDLAADPESSPAPIDHSELLMALKRVEVSPYPANKKNRKNLVHEFTKIPSNGSAAGGM